MLRTSNLFPRLPLQECLVPESHPRPIILWPGSAAKNPKCRIIISYYFNISISKYLHSGHDMRQEGFEAPYIMKKQQCNRLETTIKTQRTNSFHQTVFLLQYLRGNRFMFRTQTNNQPIKHPVGQIYQERSKI